jgi:hypothetical protein
LQIVNNYYAFLYKALYKISDEIEDDGETFDDPAMEKYGTHKAPICGISRKSRSTPPRW